MNGPLEIVPGQLRVSGLHLLERHELNFLPDGIPPAIDHHATEPAVAVKHHQPQIVRRRRRRRGRCGIHRRRKSYQNRQPHTKHATCLMDQLSSMRRRSDSMAANCCRMASRVSSNPAPLGDAYAKR